MPATGALIGTPASISDSVDAHTDAHRGRAVRAQHLGHEAQRVGELLGAGDHRQQGPLGEQAVADLAPLGAARRGRSRRWRRAACCSGACSAWSRRRRSCRASAPSGACRACVTLSTWVSPRWKRPEPWAVGDEPDLGRQGADVRRAATVDADALLDDALAHELLGERPDGGLDLALTALELVRPGPRSPPVASSVAALRSVLSAMRWASAERSRADRLHPGEHVGAVVGLRGPGRVGSCTPALATSSRCSSIDSRIQVLAASRPLGDDLLGHLGRARLVVGPGVLGAAGLDHHDGDVASPTWRAGDDQLEGRTRRPPGRWRAGSTCPRPSRRCARRRSGPRRGCPRASAPRRRR